MEEEDKPDGHQPLEASQPPQHSWDQPSDFSSSLSRSGKGKVKEGVNPFWPIVIFFVFFGGLIVAAVIWFKNYDFDRSESEVTEMITPTDSTPLQSPEDQIPKTEQPDTRESSQQPDSIPSPTTEDGKKETAIAPPKDLALEKKVTEEHPPKAPDPRPQEEHGSPPLQQPSIPESTSPQEDPMLKQPEPPPALLQALESWEKDESKEALAVIKEQAEAGWPEAQTVLGIATAQGKGVSRNFKKAIEWFKKAAEQNDGKAQFYLGQAYDKGSGVEADPIQAAAWFILSASHDYEASVLERDTRLAKMGKSDRHSAFIRARNLGPEFLAGWTRDPENGTAVWLPSWYRTGSYSIQFEVPAKDGYAHGHGKIILKASLPGDSDRVFEGMFSQGYYFGKEMREGEFHYLPSDDLLYRLPSSPDKNFSDVVFWIRTGYGVDFASNPCYVGTNQTPDLLIAVPSGFPVLNDEPVKEVMAEAWKSYLNFCPKNYHAKLTVVPPKFGTGQDRFGHRIFVPRLATGTYYGKRGETLSISNFHNHALKRHEEEQRKQAEEREKEKRRLAQLKAAAAAKTRGNPDIRGIRLGMTMLEVRDHLEDEIAEWKPPWTANRPLLPFAQTTRTILLSDGAQFTAHFTSPVNGSVLYAIAYEQNLRDGPPKEQLMGDLEAKYGKPDNYGVGKIWWDYKLVSRKKKEVMGAFMKVHFRYDKVTNKVEYLRLIINDAGFGSYDERAAYEAKLKAEQEAYEASKSDKPKF